MVADIWPHHELLWGSVFAHPRHVTDALKALYRARNRTLNAQIETAALSPSVSTSDEESQPVNQPLSRVVMVVLVAGFCLPLRGEESREQLSVRISFGHRASAETVIKPQLIAGSPGLTIVAETRSITTGAGKVDTVTADVSWSRPVEPPHKPHEIWEYLLEHGTPDQVARLRDDPGLNPQPVLTVLTAADGTRGFSIGLEQLARHKAMWLPEHDAFVTLADAPVDFADHLAALQGRTSAGSGAARTGGDPRGLDGQMGGHRQSEPVEQTLGNVLAGNPRTSRGHRGAARFALQIRRGPLGQRAAGSRLATQVPLRSALARLHLGRATDRQGLPVIVTRLAREGQQCEVEQFAAPLRDTTGKARGSRQRLFQPDRAHRHRSA